MSLIKNTRTYPSKKLGRTQTALVMCGFGGSIWQTRRLITVLRRAGYTVIALDFPETVLSSGDVRLLPQLIDEVVVFAEDKARGLTQPILLIGISLGALIALNILRRSPLFNEGVLITGGDIVKVAHAIYGSKVWPQDYDELAREWHTINMYTEPKKLAAKRLVFILPTNDKLIDTQDVRNEVRLQTSAGNHLRLIERHTFGHIGTIIEETILFPRRVLAYIEQVQK